MHKKIKHLTKQVKFHCPLCQNIYQLIEIHEQTRKSGTIPLTENSCLNQCQKKWQTILHDYYQEKVFAYLAQQEQAEEEETEWEPKLAQIKKSCK